MKSSQINLPNPDNVQAGTAPLLKTKNAKAVLEFIHSLAEMEIKIVDNGNSRLVYGKSKTSLLISKKQLYEQLGFKEITMNYCLDQNQQVSGVFLVKKG